MSENLGKSDHCFDRRALADLGSGLVDLAHARHPMSLLRAKILLYQDQKFRCSLAISVALGVVGAGVLAVVMYG